MIGRETFDFPPLAPKAGEGVGECGAEDSYGYHCTRAPHDTDSVEPADRVHVAHQEDGSTVQAWLDPVPAPPTVRVFLHVSNAYFRDFTLAELEGMGVRVEVGEQHANGAFMDGLDEQAKARLYEAVREGTASVENAEIEVYAEGHQD